MLGPIGSDVMLIFRLLSPDEIDKYIVNDTSREVGETMAMASGGESLQYDDESPHLENSSKPSKFPKDHQAKIIPLDEFKEKSKKKTSEVASAYAVQEGAFAESSELENKFQANAPISGSTELESIGVLSSSTIKEIESDREKKENDNKDSATVFLLKEREKMRISKKRLIEQYAIKSYQTNAAQEFYEETEEDLLDEDGSSDLKGILLNKKHY